MARAASTSKSKPKPTSPRPPTAVKKSLGRPLGSKNKTKVASAPTRKPAAVSVVKRTTTRKAAPLQPKMSKADLEAQVAKLERSLARSRKQVAELKLLVSAAHEPKEQVAVTKSSPALVKKAVKQKAAVTHDRRKKAVAAEPASDDATDAEETEAQTTDLEAS